LWRFAVNLKTEQEMRDSAQLRSHGNNIFEAINAAMNSLGKPELLNKMLLELGQRHKAYGAKIQHFPLIINSLLETISEILGEEYFTSSHLIAWQKVTDSVVEQMSKGMIA
jgi:hemoglobin-like flavoprotein